MNTKDYDIIKDTATLTTIPEKTLRKLISKEIYCVNEAVVEMKEADLEVINLDLGIGTLAITVDEETVYYKFIPSGELDSSVKATILNGQNFHKIGSLLPVEGRLPKFSQLYIYDTQNEISNRMTHFR